MSSLPDATATGTVVAVGARVGEGRARAGAAAARQGTSSAARARGIIQVIGVVDAWDLWDSLFMAFSCFSRGHARRPKVRVAPPGLGHLTGAEGAARATSFALGRPQALVQRVKTALARSTV